MRTKPEPEHIKIRLFNKTRNSLLFGVSGQPGPQEPTLGPGPESEECGRTWVAEVRKKALKALERWPPDPGSSPGGLKKRNSMKRLQKLTPGKETREGRSVGDRNVLQRWLQRETEGSEALKTGLGPGKAKQNQNQGGSE